ncbi:uncharacterized protein LOC123398970 [Hordeum vulgare subsp. vulgare]|uniref:F-box domain-containing protein n=1 Tax=Hordeum vulgare subsp. vulgare TaxID=112509 RepID=A0A8I6WCL8_HORVV|nr:uncharacterized protein LOC123398970 [Hordeum vulgare subsp. vulgare]
MARTATGRRRRPRGDDRISALPDDLLLVVLRRLDIRTAVGTTALSRRWACLRGELPILDLSVHAMLPPRYHRWIQLHGVVGKSGFQYDMRQVSRELLPNIRRYEHRAMRALTRSAQTFLDAPTAFRRRRISRLRLEFFVTQSTECMNRLIAEAMDACGVDDLQVVAKPIFWQRGAVHTFASHGLCKEPSASRLQSLKLGGCMLPPLYEYSALTRLVLQDIPESTPVATYQGVFTSCQQLQVLHLISCRCSAGGILVDAPMSKIKELVVDKCRFRQLRLRALPNLESLASLGHMVFLESASFPCLGKFNLTSRLGLRTQGFREYVKQRLKIDHESLLENMPEISSLIVRISGPYRWIVPSRGSPSTVLLPNLRRLLVADVPSSWDVSWPRLLLETAPSLEVLHIHIATCTQDEPSDEIRWKPTTLLRHRHLEEFVMVGYEGTERQIYLVKFVMGVCTALRQVSILRNGHARNKGHWDWELVTQQHLWTDEEKKHTLKHIMDGVSPLSPAAPVKLVFG